MLCLVVDQNSWTEQLYIMWYNALYVYYVGTVWHSCIFVSRTFWHRLSYSLMCINTRTFVLCSVLLLVLPRKSVCCYVTTIMTASSTHQLNLCSTCSRTLLNTLWDSFQKVKTLTKPDKKRWYKDDFPQPGFSSFLSSQFAVVQCTSV